MVTANELQEIRMAMIALAIEEGQDAADSLMRSAAKDAAWGDMRLGRIARALEGIPGVGHDIALEVLCGVGRKMVAEEAKDASGVV
jgi:hypothetical protein